MFRTHSRIIAAIVMFFFTWTSGGVFSIAHAAVDASKKGKVAEAAKKQADGPEERFAKLTGYLEETLTDPKGDVDKKRQRLKTGKTEMDTLDVDIRKQFAETEKKIKAAKLSPEIMERHRKFVKHYDDNLAELKGNIERVEKAKDNKEAEAEIEKVGKHLKRVKAPSHHQKLDPNNLPHRQPKAVKREPRMKKEEFEQDLKKDKHAWKNGKRIQVASAGSLAGLLVSSSINAIAPTADDLAETIEVQLTPEIKAKALELGNNPVKIYEWVRNNIEFVPTWGSIQGAQMTMLTKQGNAFDTSSLLIALLRASGISAHYVTGTIELPIDKILNWAGGFTDPQAALTFFASGGVPIKGGISGGKFTKAQMEHVWIEAYIPYGNYRGTKRDLSNPTWIPLDASFKQYTVVQGFDVTALVPFSQDGYLSRPSNQNSLHYYQSQIQTYLDTTMPDKSIVDVKGRKEIAEEKFIFLPASLPYKTLVVASKASEIAAGSRANVSFRMSSTSGELPDATYSATAPELVGKRVTLSYRPATPGDEAIVSAYGGFMFNVPAYMLQVKPELRVEGNVVLTGEATTIGNEQTMTLGFSRPGGPGDSTQKLLIAGGYYALGLDLGGVNESSLGKRNGALRDNIATLPPEAFSNDDLIGEHLHFLAMTYFFANDKLYSSGAKLYNVAQLRSLSGSFVSIIPTVTYFFSIPRWVKPSSLEMDVRLDRITAVARDGNLQAEKSYMEMAGLVSSFNEHYIFEAIDGFSSVSTVKALQAANQSGIAIYKINAANIDQIVPLLQIRQEVVADIRNSVNAGNVITIPQKNLQINDWNGVGYIVKDPASGSGAYMISGGLAGAASDKKIDAYVKLYEGPYAGIKDRLDLQTQNTIVTAANLEIGEEVVDKIGDKIVDNAASKVGKITYYKVGRCSGLVIYAYKTAGIDLRALAAKFGFGDPSNVSEMYALVKSKPQFWVGSSSPALGDIVFFQKTYTRDPSLIKPGDDNVSHVGIVSDIDEGEVTGMIHAANSIRNVVNDPFPDGIKSNSYWGPKLLGLGRPR